MGFCDVAFAVLLPEIFDDRHFGSDRRDLRGGVTEQLQEAAAVEVIVERKLLNLLTGESGGVKPLKEGVMGHSIAALEDNCSGAVNAGAAGPGAAGYNSQIVAECGRGDYRQRG